MKKYLLTFAVLAMGMAMFTSCSDDDDENVKILSFEGDQWAALIDNPQYGGELLYGEGGMNYSWTDATTKLTSSLTDPGLNPWGSYSGLAGGGVAISNYIDADIENNAVYTNQLAVPQNNGSKNFAVVYCPATVSFSDNVARTIKSMSVGPTTYELGSVTNGDGYAASLAEEGFLTVTITGKKNGTVTGTVTFDLAKDGNIMNTWQTIDLTSLGEVTTLEFDMDGSDKSDWGVKHPKYFAFDNVAVKF